MINWLWKDKQEKIPIKVRVIDPNSVQETTVRLSVELKLKHHITTDVEQVIKNAEAKLNLPREVQVVSGALSRIEIL
jgi:hypothetical protein